jgi:hypothetical protein
MSFWMFMKARDKSFIKRIETGPAQLHVNEAILRAFKNSFQKNQAI